MRSSADRAVITIVNYCGNMTMTYATRNVTRERRQKKELLSTSQSTDYALLDDEKYRLHDIKEILIIRNVKQVKIILI